MDSIYFTVQDTMDVLCTVTSIPKRFVALTISSNKKSTINMTLHWMGHTHPLLPVGVHIY